MALKQRVIQFLIIFLLPLFSNLQLKSQIALYSFNFDNDTLTGWTFNAWGLNGDANGQCSWAIGNPNGGQGYNDLYRTYEGNADPTEDFTSDNAINNVAGQGLKVSRRREGKAGHFNNSSEWFQSPLLDFTNNFDVTLEYYRWANFELGYDYGFIEVSTDGANWNVIYEPSVLQDNSWVKHTIDISKYVDRQSTVYIRWRSESDQSIFYSGWNIDDITITGKQSYNDNTSSIVAGNISVPGFISSTIDTYDEKVIIGEFTIIDAGSGDGLVTKVDTLVITPGPNNSVIDWTTSIKDIYIYEAATDVQKVGVVENGKIYFNNGSFFTIPDGESRTYEISFYLDANLSAKDNQQFEFVLDYGNVLVDPLGSFISSGELATGESKLVVDIQATQLSFLVEPEQLVNVDRDLLPNIKVAATDENGNVDVDYSGTITLSNSGGLSMSGNVEVTTSGIATFSSCQFNQTGGPVTLSNSHSGSSSITTTSTNVSVTVQDNISDIIYSANFDNTGLTGWTSGAILGSNSWTVGSPNGGRGYSNLRGSRGWVGNSDPTNDHTIGNGLNNVYGQGLSSSSRTEGISGHYNSSEEWLMSPAIDLTNYYNVGLNFWRWANFEPFYDSAFVEISLDGINWIQLDHPLFPADQQWTQVNYDISSIADRQPTVYIRWRTISDESIFYAGWNIDDVEITGIFSPVTNWVGTTSTDWNTASNWSSGIVPNRLSNVYIDAATPYRPIVTSTAECNEIIIKKDAILEIDFGGDLTVFGDVQIETDSRNYGALLDRGNITIYGKGKVSRYLLANQWHYVSAPVTNVNSSKFGDNIYFYDEVQASDNWFNGWVSAENISLEAARGYDVQRPQDEIVNIEGSFNTGNIGITVTNTDGVESADHEGWNLVGNPYPSAIDWDASGWTKTNVDDAIYIWDESQQNYVTYISGVGTFGGSNYIPPMQGFFVRVPNPGSGYIGMTNDVRIANTSSKFKSSGSNEDGVKIGIANSSFNDETIIRFLDGAGNNFDQSLDAHKKFSSNSSVPQIFTKTAKGELLSINTLPSNSDYSVVQLYVTLPYSGDNTLSFDGVWNIHYSQTIYLEDTEKDTLIDLFANRTYSFYSKTTTANTRFKLHIGMPLQIKHTVKQVSVWDKFDGEIDLTIIGGKQPISNVEWSNGSKTEDLSNLGSGMYIVTVTDAENNSITDTVLLTSIGNFTSIETSEESASELNVFSVNNALHITSTDKSKPINTIEVYNLMGKKMYSSEELYYGKVVIPLNLQFGMYIVCVKQENISVTEKIILK